MNKSDLSAFPGDELEQARSGGCGLPCQGDKQVLSKECTAHEGREWVRVFDSIADLISVHDRNFRIVRVNKAFCDFVGRSADDLVGRHCYDIFHELQEPIRNCPHARALKTKSTTIEEVLSPRGDAYWLITCSPFYDDEGNLTGSVHIVKDITKRKRAEEMLLHQINNMKALADIGMTIGSSLDLRVTLRVVLERLIAQLGVDAADVLLLDQDNLYLRYSAGMGFRTPAIKDTRVRMGKGHVGRAVFERQTLIVRSLSETLTRALKGEGFESYIAVPLIAHGKVTGALEIFHRKPLNPSSEWLGFLELLAGQAAIAIDNATLFDSLQRANTELTISYDVTLEGWGRTLEFRDADTKGHTERVTEMTLRLARIMGVAEHGLVHVRRGAMLHDIGKINIPDSILLKPGPLTEDESAIMQLHPVYAHELLSAIPFLRPAIDIPYCHHEKWDGRGYPRGLRGEGIPFDARIFTVIDVADALGSDRPYRGAWSTDKVRDYIRSMRGVQFDPAVVDAFLDMEWG
jgi:PAS domain S-box-containing protein